MRMVKLQYILLALIGFFSTVHAQSGSQSIIAIDLSEEAMGITSMERLDWPNLREPALSSQINKLIEILEQVEYKSSYFDQGLKDVLEIELEEIRTYKIILKHAKEQLVPIRDNVIQKISSHIIAIQNAFMDYSLAVPVVTYVTSKNADGIYGPGKSLAIELNFSKPILVVGNPLLTLETGKEDRDIYYAAGSGTNKLIFLYTIRPGDSSPDLDYRDQKSLKLNGGSIKDTFNNDANLILPPLGSKKSLGGRKSLLISPNL